MSAKLRFIPSYPFAILLTLTLLTAATARADSSTIPTDGQTTVLARVDGEVRSVATLSRSGGLRIADTPSARLFAVDLATQSLPATAVTFALERDQRLRLEVLDVDGNLVRTLADGLWAQGRHQLAWQHDDDAGDRLTEGRYVVRLVTEAAGETVALAR